MQLVVEEAAAAAAVAAAAAAAAAAACCIAGVQGGDPAEVYCLDACQRALAAAAAVDAYTDPAVAYDFVLASTAAAVDAGVVVGPGGRDEFVSKQVSRLVVVHEALGITV